MKKTKKTIFLICRLLVGLLFIFSGAVKAIDPLGSVYKITDYMEAMGLAGLTEYGWIAYIAAFALFAFEFAIGVCLVTNMNFKLGMWAATLFMAVMTGLTVWIAKENPVTDCGCFGDAIVLTNVQTLIKNIVIDVLIVIMWIFRKANRNWKTTILSWLVTVAAVAIAVLFGLWTLNNLPVVDFRPYKIGADIRELAIGTPDKTEVYHIYKKDGVTKEVPLKDLANTDLKGWEWVEQKSVILEKGMEPPIHDFVIFEDKNNITEDVLNYEGKTYLVVMWNLDKTETSAEMIRALNQLQDSVTAEGAMFMGITASDSTSISKFMEGTGANFGMWFMDGIQLKTMVRANPGIFVIEKGVVVEKYNANKLIIDK